MFESWICPGKCESGTQHRNGGNESSIEKVSKRAQKSCSHFGGPSYFAKYKKSINSVTNRKLYRIGKVYAIQFFSFNFFFLLNQLLFIVSDRKLHHQNLWLWWYVIFVVHPMPNNNLLICVWIFLFTFPAYTILFTVIKLSSWSIKMINLSV